MARKALALLLGTVVALLLCEVLLRIAGFSHPSFFQPDPHTGSALRPGAAAWQYEEGEAWFEVNRDGLRDEERPRAKPPGTFRIAVLGDSYTMAGQVDVADAWWAVMERELAHCPSFAGRTVDAMNFGVAGFGTAQEYQLLRHRALDFEPDFVLLGFLTGNDVSDNSFALSRMPMRPYFVLRRGRLALDDRFLDSAAYRRRSTRAWQLATKWIDHSRLLQLMTWTRQRAAIASARAASPAADDDTGLGDFGLDPLVYLPPRDAAWKKAWEVTEALLVAMSREASIRRIGFAVVTLTNPPQVHPDAERRARYATAVGAPDLLYPDRRIRALGERNGFPVLMLAPPLLEYVERTGAYLHGFENHRLGGGHWNALGHRLAGEHVAAFLCALDEEAPKD